MKTKIKNYATIALFMAFSFMTTIVSANDGNKDTPGAELKYLGLINNQPIFQLNVNSDKEEYFVISVKDQFGETLYSEKVKTKIFTRNFRLDTENLDDAMLRVEVRSGNKKPEVFTINRNTRFYEETSINKL
jgi:hypothetical protein